MPLTSGSPRHAGRGPLNARKFVYLLLVVVVDAETPEELVEAFDWQALRLLRAAAAKAIRAKNLMVFIYFLLVHLRSRLVAVEQTLAARGDFATRIAKNFVAQS